MSRNNDIDKLIDAGLNRYSAGDLDGALVAWEQALAIEPANPQATSYLGYVRINYEALQSASQSPVATDSVSHPALFAIDDSPQYVIGSSELDSASVVTEPVRRAPAVDSYGDDWFFEDDVALGTLQRSRTQSIDLSPASLAELALQFSLEDDEALGTGDAVSFESLTTEYPATAQRSSAEGAEARRSNPKNATTGARVSRPPQFEVRVRSPSSAPGDQRSDQATLDPYRELASFAPAEADNSAIERALQEIAPISDDSARATDDLIASLPIPRRVATARGSERPISGGEASAHQPVSFADGSANTADPRGRGTSQSSTPDSGSDMDLPELPGWAPVLVEDVPVDIPTGELPRGLHAEVDDDNLPTRQSARAITARSVGRARTGASTGRDLLPQKPPRADSIDACAAQILDEIDAEGGRTDEPKDDRIRRRLTALFSRAAVWTDSEPEKAVCAVELALSEDPGSALAQKLIHRNREAIMTVFHNYLGNLDRKPQLERPLHELESVSITPRAAFLLSRIDGELTLDEILDVSGMPRLEAYRHLCQLFLRKILG